MATANPAFKTMDSIYGRRSVRDYKKKAVDAETVRALLDAAVHAPTAMHEESWTFVVVQDKKLLDKLSESAKKKMTRENEKKDSPMARQTLDIVSEPGFNVFYNATTLIIICSKSQEITGIADGWLAAQNLMLAAHAKGLGSCVIGLSIAEINTPEWKAELGIPAGMAAIAPIIVGYPAGKAPVSARKPPEILAWK